MLAFTLYACGGQDAKPASDAAEGTVDTAAEQDAAVDTMMAPASAPAVNPGQAPLTVADIDRWEKGMAGELEAVRAAAAKLKQAKNADDTLTAMMGVQDMATAAAGYLAPTLGGIDTTMLSPEQRAELKKNNETQLARMKDRVPPDVVEALRPRAMELRKKDLELTGERLKGAGAAA